jgi:hypothetical protein
VELAPAIIESQKSERSVIREGVRVGSPGHEQEVRFEVIPVKLPGIESRYFLILFDRAMSGALLELSSGDIVS